MSEENKNLSAKQASIEEGSQFNKRSRVNNYLGVLLQTKMSASNLLETIRKEYHLK